MAERSAVGSMRSERGAFGHNKSTSRQDFRLALFAESLDDFRYAFYEIHARLAELACDKFPNPFALCPVQAFYGRSIETGECCAPIAIFDQDSAFACATGSDFRGL